MERRECNEKTPFLADPDTECQAVTQPPLKRVGWRHILAIYGYTFLLALVVSQSRLVLVPDHHKEKSCDTIDGFVCRPEVSRNWGQYSPYFSVPSEIDDELPDDCEITFAQILSRHGARDPTLSRSLKYIKTLFKLQATAKNYTGKYEFLKDYRYHLGADQLNELGRRQLYNSGVKFYHRYKKLTSARTPFIRTSGQQRVVESATSWTEGYHHAKANDKSADKDDTYPYDMVTINEGPLFNNTLDHSLCTNIETGPLHWVRKDAKHAWINVFGPPILSRLQRDFPSSLLNLKDMHALMSLCAFDTVASPVGKLSPFCNMFTDEEWIKYNHFESLEKFYGWAKGNPLGPTQGVGFANELIARLTHSPVKDHTSVNHTLDDNEETFPIDGKHKLFADFSHDNDLTSIFFALGLYDSTPMLSITQVDSMAYTRGWSSSWGVPFAARAYFEKMQCRSKGDDELVRVIVNDRVLPLESCGGDELGRCKLDDFVESLSFAKQGGRWEQCFTDLNSADVKLPSGMTVDELQTVYFDNEEEEEE